MSSMLLLKMPLTIKLLHKNKTPNFIFTIFTNGNMDTYVSMESKCNVMQYVIGKQNVSKCLKKHDYLNEKDASC